MVMKHDVKRYDYVKRSEVGVEGVRQFIEDAKRSGFEEDVNLHPRGKFVFVGSLDLIGGEPYKVGSCKRDVSDKYSLKSLLTNGRSFTTKYGDQYYIVNGHCVHEDALKPIEVDNNLESTHSYGNANDVVQVREPDGKVVWARPEKSFHVLALTEEQYQQIKEQFDL